MPGKVCASCRAPIVWVATPSGGRMPCDPEVHTASVGGKDRLVTDDGRVVACTIKQGSLFGGQIRGRVSHFATCPHAGEHRRA